MEERENIQKKQEDFDERQLKKHYVDNLLGYVFMAQVNNKYITSIEDDALYHCHAKDFWDTININVMDIDVENEELKKCDYIKGHLTIEYGERTIKINIAK